MPAARKIEVSHGKTWEKTHGENPAAGADLSPDVILQSAMISACGKGQQWLKSLELLRLEVPRDMKNGNSSSTIGI